MALQTKKIEVEVEVRGVKINGSPLTASVLSNINSKNASVVGRGESKMVISNTIGIAGDKFCSMVNSWDGAVDQDGVDLECTEDIKKAVFQNDPDFASAVITAVNEKVLEVREINTKN